MDKLTILLVSVYFVHHIRSQGLLSGYDSLDYPCGKNEDCIDARYCKKTLDLLQGSDADVREAQMQYCDIVTEGKRSDDVLFGHSLERAKGIPMVCCNKTDRVPETLGSYCSSSIRNLRLRHCGRSPTFYLNFAAKAYLIARDVRYRRLPKEGCGNHTGTYTEAPPKPVISWEIEDDDLSEGGGGRRRTKKSRTEKNLLKTPMNRISENEVDDGNRHSMKLENSLQDTREKKRMVKKRIRKDRPHRKRKKRLAGGNPARIGQFPFLVSLLHTDYVNNSVRSFGCMGTIIHHRVILTSKDCIYKRPIVEAIAGEFGINSTNEEGSYYQVINDLKYLLKPPPQKVVIDSYLTYDSHIYDTVNSSVVRVYDIALLRVKYPFKFNEFVEPVCIPLADSPKHMRGNFSGTAIALGYGTDSPYQFKTHPRYLKVQIASSEDCQSYYNNELQIPHLNGEPAILCAGGVKDEGSCRIEQGSPLLVRNDVDGTFFQVGVMNEQIRQYCRNFHRPPTYINIPAHKDFIKGAMNDLLFTHPHQSRFQEKHQCLSEKEKKNIPS